MGEIMCKKNDSFKLGINRIESLLCWMHLYKYIEFVTENIYWSCNSTRKLIGHQFQLFSHRYGVCALDLQ